MLFRAVVLSVVPGPAASASLGNVLEMQILGSHSRPSQPETVGMAPSNVFTAPHPPHPSDSNVHSSLRSTGGSDLKDVSF